MNFDNQPPKPLWYRHGRHVRADWVALLPRGLRRLNRWARISEKSRYAEERRQTMNIFAAVDRAMGPLLDHHWTPAAQVLTEALAVLPTLTSAVQENPGASLDARQHAGEVIGQLRDIIADLERGVQA